MRALVLGGTRFVGRAIVDELLARGHEPTLFHRGQSGAGLFPDCQRVLGDRRESLGALAGREWDWVLDVCAYIPREARMAGEAFARCAARCLTVSTVSVYAPTGGRGPAEGDALLELDDPATETVDASTYGGLKSLVEMEAQAAWGSRLLTVRPGLVAGPWDTTDRFTYWATRDSPHPAPDRLGQPMQIVDVRDLATFCVRSLEQGLHGPYNVCGDETTLAGMLSACGVEPTAGGAGQPLVLPGDGSADYFLRCSNAKAKSAGLSLRPLAETARDTRAWWESQGRPRLSTEPS